MLKIRDVDTNVPLALRKKDIFVLNSIQNYIFKINTVLITYRRNNAVSILFTTAMDLLLML